MTDAAPELPPAPDQTAGAMLRQAREAHGLSVAEVATRTRVPQRHLEAIERSDYPALPSPTYAVGFAKAYARAVGASEVAVAAKVRDETGRLVRPPEYVPYETADPARVPPRWLAIVAAGLALAVLVLAGLYYGTDVFRGGGGASASDVASAVPEARPTSAARSVAPAAPTGGEVVLIATDQVWLRVYDAANKTLFLGTMKPGDKFVVPAGADAPKINVGRPDKLQVTLNGAAAPPLGDGSHPIKDVAVDGTSVAARLRGAPSPVPTSAAGAASAATGASSRTSPPAAQPALARSHPSPATAASRQPRPAPRPTPTRPAGPENLLPSGFGTGRQP